MESIFADIESLRLYAGTHRKVFGYYRQLAKRFPYAIYYQMEDGWPFAPPLGDYYAKIYKPAIEKAGLRPVRADTEIFGTGKIMDQIWTGIHAAKVLVAELTNRNPNVFYELGLAHAQTLSQLATLAPRA